MRANEAAAAALPPPIPNCQNGVADAADAAVDGDGGIAEAEMAEAKKSGGKMSWRPQSMASVVCGAPARGLDSTGLCQTKDITRRLSCCCCCWYS